MAFMANLFPIVKHENAFFSFFFHFFIFPIFSAGFRERKNVSFDPTEKKTGKNLCQKK